MVSFWQFYPDIHSFKKLADERKEKILKAIMSPEATRSYQFENVVRDIIGELDKDTAMQLFGRYLDWQNTGYTEIAYQIVEKIYDNYIGKKQEIKDMIIERGKPHAVRVLLFLNDITHKEEELGLRALAGTKYAPSSLHDKKYKPSREAVKNLPPVTRLKTFETLLNNDHLSYNMFSNFDDPVEFEALMFSAAFRHLDRARSVVERYNELRLMGQEALVTVKMFCDNCGDHDITIKSGRVRTQAGLDRTKIGPYLTSNSCVLCGRYSKGNKQVVCPIEV